MPEPLPALCLIAVPGRRRRTIELAQETERRGFAGIYTPSPFGNMIPTCISDDVEAAKAVNRRTLSNYAFLPNYRNYWKEAGYVEEMDAIETAVAEGRRDDVAKYLSDKWLADNTLFGPPAKVREGVAAWRAAGVHTPILVPSSAAGNQLTAVEEIFAAFA